MFPLPKHVKKFLAISYIFSFIIWFGAWYLANSLNVSVLPNNEIYFWNEDRNVLLVSLLFSLATLGPFLGSLYVRNQSDISITTKGIKNALFVFAILSGIIALFSAIVKNFDGSPASLSIKYVLFTLFYFALTSGTEEFGWRGVLYPHIKLKSKSLWQSAIYTGLIWGPWHTPFVLYLFIQAGMPFIGILFSYAGFIVTIIMMSYLHGWINVRGSSTLANYTLHTLHNWMPIAIVYLFGESDYAPIITIVAYVLTIILMEKKFPSNAYFTHIE